MGLWGDISKFFLPLGNSDFKITCIGYIDTHADALS